jgi:hypothetical protein
VTFDDEAAAWIKDKADERDVPMSKVIRDSVATAQVTGFVRGEDVELADAESLLDRIEKLETRVEALESAGEPGETNDSAHDDLITAFQRQLVGQPPTKDHGKEAVTRVFELLLNEGQLSSKELRNRLHPEFEDKFSNADSMWQSIQRHLADLDGISKPEKGVWEANPDAVDTTTGGFENWKD